MAEQPQTMEELLQSIRDARGPVSKIVPTVATKELRNLSQAQRDLANQYFSNAISQYAGLAQAQPGESIPVQQTDEWYRNNDQNGTFGRLSAYVSEIGSRMR